MFTFGDTIVRSIVLSTAYNVLREGSSLGKPPRLLDRLRQTLRTKHYAYSTEQAYAHWVRRYILFHEKRVQKRCHSWQEPFLVHRPTRGSFRGDSNMGMVSRPRY